MRLPPPGETVLVLATIYAATDPNVNVRLVITAAAVGSIIGDNVGYLDRRWMKVAAQLIANAKRPKT